LEQINLSTGTFESIFEGRRWKVIVAVSFAGGEVRRSFSASANLFKILGLIGRDPQGPILCQYRCRCL
jgi:hypothetical protein